MANETAWEKQTKKTIGETADTLFAEGHEHHHERLFSLLVVVAEAYRDELKKNGTKNPTKTLLIGLKENLEQEVIRTNQNPV